MGGRLGERPEDPFEGKGDGPTGSQRGLGGVVASDGGVRFRLFSARATRIELLLYDQAFGADEVARIPLTRGSDGLWSTTVSAAELPGEHVFYGYRAWGPNWPYDPAWTAGSSLGFLADVDAEGNRFNPNKLLLDPSEREVSNDRSAHARTRRSTRAGLAPQQDSARVAPKGSDCRFAAAIGTKRPARQGRGDLEVTPRPP